MKTSFLFTVAALSIVSVPALAASFSGAATVTATGHVTGDGFGNNYDCTITINFTNNGTNLTSTGGTTSNDHGGVPTYQPCDSSSGVFDTFVVTPTSTSVVKVARIDFSTPTGVWRKNDASFNWNNGPSSEISNIAGQNSQVGFYRITSLTLSFPNITLVP